MSRDNPTPEELDEIEQFQHGAYGAQPPEWWFDQKNTSRTMIPADIPAAAVDASSDLIALELGTPTTPQIYRHLARLILEAAAPHLLKELRELVENMEAQPWTEVGTIPGMAALIRSSARGML